MDAFPWDEPLRHLIRGRDGAFGPAYTRRIRAMSRYVRGKNARRKQLRRVSLSGVQSCPWVHSNAGQVDSLGYCDRAEVRRLVENSRSAR